MKREEVLKKITQAIHFGNLGLFMGAGFTKALSYDGLSWEELIKESANKTIQGISGDKNATFEYDNLDLNGKSYPEIPTEICKKISMEKDIEYKNISEAFKARVCEVALIHAEEDKRKEFNQYFKCISPSWIITTNYDNIIESIIEEHYISLGANDLLLMPKGKIPIYHLHGHRSNSDSLVILNEVI